MTNYNYLYDKSSYEKYININHLSNDKLLWKEIDNATILPFRTFKNGKIGGGLLDGNGNYIDGTSLHRGFGGKYDYKKGAVTYSSEEVVFLGLWPDIWGHWLTDNIRRLWVLKNDEFMSKYGHLKFLYLVYRNHKPCDNAKELLSIIGGDKITIEPIDRVVRYRKVILPDESFFSEKDSNRFFTKEYVDMLDDIRRYGEEHYNDTGMKKVYFTYRKYTNIRTVGEYRLEGFFKNRGYSIVSPEKFTLKEQLNILMNCDECAMTAGSVSHNIIFLRDNTKVFIIPRNGSITKYQFALDQIHNLDITYVDSSLSLYLHPDYHWGGPFYFIISDNLLDCFGVKMNSRNNTRGFAIYRQLAYMLNGCQKSGEYYKKEYKKYLNVKPSWIENYSVAHKVLQKIKVQRVISILLVKYEIMCNRRSKKTR